jgi:hypothetical protein
MENQWTYSERGEENEKVNHDRPMEKATPEKVLQRKMRGEAPKSRSKLPPLDLDGHAATIGGLREKTLWMKARGEKLKLLKPEVPK